MTTETNFQQPEVIIDFKMGECFTVLLSGRGAVQTLGENIEGQLGIEGVTHSDSPINVQGLPCIGQVDHNYTIIR